MRRFTRLTFLLGISGWVCGVLFLGPARAEYQSKGKRDPFVPLLAADGQRFRPPGLDEEVMTQAIGMALQGVVYEPKAESYAVIDGQVVREGDEIGGAKIIKIEPNSVTIQKENQISQIVLQPSQEEN